MLFKWSCNHNTWIYNFKRSANRLKGQKGKVGKRDGTGGKPRWSIYRYAQDVEQAVDEGEDQVELKGRAFERGNIANPGVLGRKNLCVRKCNLRRAWKRRKLWSNVTYTYKTYVCTYIHTWIIYSCATKIRDSHDFDESLSIPHTCVNHVPLNSQNPIRIYSIRLNSLPNKSSFSNTFNPIFFRSIESTSNIGYV